MAQLRILVRSRQQCELQGSRRQCKKPEKGQLSGTHSARLATHCHAEQFHVESGSGNEMVCSWLAEAAV